MNSSCVTGLSPSGHCGAAYYCEKPWNCCAQCNEKCNSECGWLESTAQKKKSRIVMIRTDNLMPHPDNPRKDVGDVTELAESIRANGVLQNLTVVPKEDGKYTVIIGHRRLAASKVAGISELPCVIADMTPEEQIATMLTENMQRTDLTVYEQAKAFHQLSFDLGMSIPEITKKSGFSESTVRKRMKLAELDDKALKKACERGATLYDLAELEKIEDPAAKQKCLEAAGGQNFKNELKIALNEQKARARMQKWAEQLDMFATRIEQVGYVPDEKGEPVFVKMNYFRNFGSWTNDCDIEAPNDGKRYFYTWSNLQISVYREETETEEEAKEKQRKLELRERSAAGWDRMQAIIKRHAELRRDFILGYNAGKCTIPIILRNLPDAMVKEGIDIHDDPDEQDLCEMIGAKYDRDKVVNKSPEFRELKAKNPERLMLILTYWFMEEGSGYAMRKWNVEGQRYETVYKDNQKLDDLYYFLEELGYSRSDEELQMARGTHPLFEKEDEG